MNIGNYIACAAGGALLGSAAGPKGAIVGAFVGVISIGIAVKLDKIWGEK
ncbi:MAG: hypothetical protein ACYSR0_09305 [Planctomycetota bacterium]|jgi:hypothetical protein